MTYRLSGGTWLALFIILSLVVITSAVGWWVWTEAREVQIGLHGWIALMLGVVVTTALGIGLMLLVWRSHKSGHDDIVGRDE